MKGRSVRTCGDIVDLVAAKSGLAWELVRVEAVRLAPRVGLDLGLRSEDTRELISEALVRTFQDSCVSLKRSRAATPIRAWIKGLLRMIGREMLRKRARTLGLALPSADQVAQPPPSSAEYVSEPDGVSCIADLEKSPEFLGQRAAYDLFIEGHTFVEIGHRLEISWHAARARVTRALRQVRRGAREEPDRSWAAREIRSPGVKWPKPALRMLMLYFSGATYAEIGRAVGLSREVVRGRLRRLRRRHGTHRPGSAR